MGYVASMTGKSTSEQEQMGKQMREPLGCQLSSDMHLGIDATSFVSAVCCPGHLHRATSGPVVPIWAINGPSSFNNHGLSSHLLVKVPLIAD